MAGGTLTKGELITLCSKGIHGRMNLDRAVFNAYIEVYLSAAINFAIMKQYYIDYNSEGFAELNGAFIGVFEDVAIQYNEKRKVNFLELPAKLAPIPMDRAIQFVGPMENEANQFKLVSQKELSTLIPRLPFTKKTFATVEGKTLVLRNLPDVVKKALVKMVVSITDLDDDDNVGIPAGGEIEVINIVVEFFLGVRRLPENKLNDNKFIDA